MCADDLVQVLPYILVKAKIQRMLAHFNYIDAFHYSTNDGDQVEVYKTNLKIAVERIKDFELPTEKKEEFEMRVEEHKTGELSTIEEETGAIPQSHGYEDGLAAAGMNFDEDRFQAYRESI